MTDPISVHRFLLALPLVALLFTVHLESAIVHGWIMPPSTTSSLPEISRRYTITNNGRPVVRQHRTILNAERKKRVTSEIIEFIDDPVDPKESVGDAAKARRVPPEQDDLAPLVRCIVNAADQRKADNIVALRVSPISTITSFVVFLTGNSRPQNQAIAAAIQKDVQEQFQQLPGSTGVPEGTADSGWMVLDYGSVMVHVMTPKSRLFYNVEGNWRDKGAEVMDISDIIIPNTMSAIGSGNSGAVSQRGTVSGDQDDDDDDDDSSSTTRGPGRMENLDEKDDPFWS
jgi:ribosome-associated protein